MNLWCSFPESRCHTAAKQGVQLKDPTVTLSVISYIMQQSLVLCVLLIRFVGFLLKPILLNCQLAVEFCWQPSMTVVAPQTCLWRAEIMWREECNVLWVRFNSAISEYILTSLESWEGISATKLIHVNPAELSSKCGLYCVTCWWNVHSHDLGSGYYHFYYECNHWFFFTFIICWVTWQYLNHVNAPLTQKKSGFS